jgi:hypothetical protein
VISTSQAYFRDDLPKLGLVRKNESVRGDWETKEHFSRSNICIEYINQSKIKYGRKK